MTAPAFDRLTLEVRALRSEVLALRDEVRCALRRDSLTPAQRVALRSIVALYQPGEAFTSASALDAAQFDPAVRAGLRQACDGSAHRLGIVLGQLAESGAVLDELRLVRLPHEAGSRRWALQGVESL